MLIVDDRAREDLREAFQWYEKQQVGLGDRFLGAFRDACRRIEDRPGMHPIAADDVRFVLLRRFPYVVYFRSEEKKVVILGVIHGHRDPQVWQSRIK